MRTTFIMQHFLLLTFLSFSLFAFTSPALAHPDHDDCTEGKPLALLQHTDRDCWCRIKSQQSGDIPIGCSADNVFDPLRENFGANFSDLATLLGTDHLGGVLDGLSPLIETITSELATQTDNPSNTLSDYPVGLTCLGELKALKWQLENDATIVPPSSNCVTQLKVLFGDEDPSALSASSNKAQVSSGSLAAPSVVDTLSPASHAASVVTASTNFLSFLSHMLRSLFW
jgi:hypothetical protein